MATVKDRHIVLLCHLIDGGEEAQEVLLSINILLTVCREEDVLTLLQTKTLVNITCLNLCKVLIKYLSHRRTSHVCTLTR